ncbi:hypothetical protein A3Q56_07428 [Intoshia linei]|uniref:Uncharacterized protein n=1 Tax=Intoshia linei TaxID=1819745 RepID=A0A177AS92_9BILA|nr:hypothetical protein A3Q56_07428 [Intoshia linei]
MSSNDYSLLLQNLKELLDVDFYTILLSQRVFEGMVDEHCGIKCGNVVYNDINNKKITMRLNNEIYESLKHCNFSIVPQKLHNIMNFLKSGYEKGRDMQSLSEMINFVSKDMSELKQQEIMINCCNINLI